MPGEGENSDILVLSILEIVLLILIYLQCPHLHVHCSVFSLLF